MCVCVCVCVCDTVRVEVRLSELESLRKEEASALEHHKAAVDDIRGVLTTLQTQVRLPTQRARSGMRTCAHTDTRGTTLSHTKYA